MKKGSTVRWNTPQGETTGKTVEKKTSEFTLAGQKFKASKEQPYWIVESDSGKKAAHKESSLTEK